MRPTVGQNDGHIEHVEWLSWEQGTLGGDGLCFVKVLRVVIQQVLFLGQRRRSQRQSGLLT